MLSIIVLSVIMVIATIEDIVLRQLPIICFSLFDVYLTVYTLYKNTFEIGMIYGLIIGSVPFLIMALLKYGGIGDVIMMGTLGYYFGIYYVDVIIIISFLFFIVFSISTRINEKFNTNYKVGDTVKAYTIEYDGEKELKKEKLNYLLHHLR